ncbi:YwqG family protein [Nannocystis radixulma]|uniref:YwqG family protein n=1 Tax=Nannocystis radixulma TaxID=2995305 RepID=A0ABT5BK22_9BACT|nr:YwqG family protein [Nannocystis radixulma]MDC0673945.1 YwqG family protein [Nannocystis radixulma]
MSTQDDLRELFQRILPQRAGAIALLLAPGHPQPVWRDENGHLRAALTLVYFDAADSDTPRDVREQEVYLGDEREHPPARLRAYLEGNLRAIPAILAAHGDDADTLLPCDLFAYADLLADDALEHADEFAAALGDPARLAAMNEAAGEAAWRDELAALGLAEHAAEVRALARPALRLHLDPDEEDDDSTCPMGQTRLGGEPDLPPSCAWPEVDGVLLTFVAQFDLAELVGRPAAGELPAHGLLSFFYAPIPPDGVRGHPVRVLHFTDLDELARRPVPAGVEKLRAHAIDLEDEVHFPSLASDFFYESLLPFERVLACHRGRRQGTGEELVPSGPLAYFIAGAERINEPERPFHRLLGHPAAIQGDPYLDIEIAARPQGWDGWEDGTEEALKIHLQALRWRLLLQIDAVEQDGLLLNQDGGFFYFWIPADALARHDWTQARGELQCH